MKIALQLNRLRYINRYYRRKFSQILLYVSVILFALMSCRSPLLPGGQSSVGQPSVAQVLSRDPWLWPFDQNSIWNLPLGSGAIYQPANLPPGGAIGVDNNLLYRIPAGSPLRQRYDPGSWEKRCSGTTQYDDQPIGIPDALIVPDSVTEPPESYSTPNNAAALLQPDGRTLIQLEPLARCKVGGPVYGYRYTPDLDLYGPGIGGSQFGSGLSAIGGTIRLGELTGSDPIRHVLKVELWENYTYYNPQDPTPGYRWPAERSDAIAPKAYKGRNPQLEMGALLAIPPQITAQQLQLRTPAAIKIFQALQDYGAYHVDSTSWDSHAIAVEAGVEQEFATSYGYGMEGEAGSNLFVDDMMKIFPVLAVVTNNSPISVGGGGVRRAPLAPALTPAVS